MYFKINDLFYILGSHTWVYRGFGYLCHGSDDKDEIVRQIANFSLNNDGVITLNRGGSASHFLRLSEWKQECTSFFNRYFLKRLNDIICIPQHGDTLIKTLSSWCQITQKKNRQGALIIKNFDLLEHVKFLKISENIMNYQNMINRSSCYLVYNSSENVILYLLKCKDENCEKNLEDEMKQCISDIHLLINLYQDELKDSGITIIGLVVTNSENHSFKLKCEFCKIFVVSMKLFENIVSFSVWWKEYSRWFEISTSDLNQSSCDSFAAFCAKILSLMACTNCTFLPNFTKSISSQIEQLCLLLNPEQMEIVYSPFNYTILKGNFGTGKTIIMQKKLENLAKVMQKDELIYYINYDHKSNALIGVKQFIEKICPKYQSNIRIRKNTNDLKLSGIFQSISNEVDWKIKSVHAFIDEYNGEDLTASEVEVLKKKLQGKQIFKNSIVFIAAQPVEKERIDSFSNSSETHRSVANLFDQLRGIFQIEELTSVMRTTVQINTVVELALEYLENKQNVFMYSQPQASLPSSPARGQVLARKASSESAPLFIPKLSWSDGETTINVDTPKYFQNGRFAGGDKSSEVLDFTAKTNDQQPSCKSPVVHFKHVIDLDQAFKEAAKVNIDNKKVINKLKTVSSYAFISGSEIGHQIESSVPKLIRPCQSDNDIENVFSLSAVLDLLDIGKHTTVIIHFEQYPPPILMEALKNVLPLSVSFDVQKFTDKKSNSVLVTNFQYVRGMEFENVIVMIDPDEYFLKQYLPEAMSRCTRNLSLIVLKDKNLKKKEETVKGVLELFEKQEPSIVEKWVTEQCKKCKKKSNYYCYKSDGNNKRVGINVLSEEFKQMKKHFEPEPLDPVDGTLDEKSFAYSAEIM